MRVQIVTPDATFYDGQAGLVVLPGQNGEFGVLPGHAPLIAALGHGVARVLDKVEGQVLARVAVYGGFAKAQAGGEAGKGELEVTVLAGGAAKEPESPDPDAARKSLDEAKDALAKARESGAAEADVAAAQEQVDRARTYLDLLEK